MEHTFVHKKHQINQWPAHNATNAYLNLTSDVTPWDSVYVFDC